MSKYSEIFLLGKAEYENIGNKLRLRRYNSWLAEEVWAREEQSKRKARFSLQVLHLSRRIATEKGIDEEEAFAAIQNQNGASSNILTDYFAEMQEIMDGMPSARDQFEQIVTLFFQNRGEVLISKKWQPTSDWTTEDTRMLPAALLSQVEAFMLKEDVSLDMEDEQDEDIVEEGEELPK